MLNNHALLLCVNGKNSMKKIFFTLVIFSFFSSCKMALEAPTVSRAYDFKISKITTEAIEAEIVIDIKNPNPIGFNIYKSSFEITYCGVYLGKSFMKKKISVASKSNKAHTFYLKSFLKDRSLSELTSLVGNKAGQMEIKGKIKVGKFFYKKKFDINYRQKVSLTN